MDHNGGKHSHHREKGDSLTRQPSLQEVVLTKKEDCGQVVSHVRGSVSAHIRVLTHGIKDLLGKTGRNESQGDEEGCEDEPSPIQIDATKSEIGGSKGL